MAGKVKRRKIVRALSSRQEPTSCDDLSNSRVILGYGTPLFPLPLPSPAGRGRIVGRRLGKSGLVRNRNVSAEAVELEMDRDGGVFVQLRCVKAAILEK